MSKKIDWSKYPNFSEKEFACKETGECAMDEDFLAKVQALRTELGFSLSVTSGFRSVRHSVEVAKASPGTHTKGIAADFGVMGASAFDLVAAALRHGFTGIGVSQRSGKARFIHLDTSKERRAIWSY